MLLCLTFEISKRYLLYTMQHDRDSTFSDTSSPLADLIDTFYELEEDGRQYRINLEVEPCHPLPSDEREEGRLLV
jgi:exonuclease V gamma subunit